MDDRTRWPKWIGRVAAGLLGVMLWGVIYMIWMTVSKL